MQAAESALKASPLYYTKHQMTKVLLALIAALCFSAVVQAAGLECIVPSKPGGAMDLTCKLAQKGLQGLPDTPAPAVRIC
jgi:tripartite-type tricarboxylate transporter receptor subunit TctC